MLAFGLMAIKKDGLLFFPPEPPDTPVSDAPEHYPVFLHSARQKHGMALFLGVSGEEALGWQTRGACRLSSATAWHPVKKCIGFNLGTGEDDS